MINANSRDVTFTFDGGLQACWARVFSGFSGTCFFSVHLNGINCRGFSSRRGGAQVLPESVTGEEPVNRAVLEELFEESRVIDDEIRDQARRVVDWGRINEFGYDEFGFHPPAAMRVAAVAKLLYRHYFRVEARGLENVPAQGRVMLYANHSGQLPLDGMVIAGAQFYDRRPPRIVRSLFEYWFPTLPFVGTMLNRAGQVTGLPENAIRLMETDQCLLVFPEGIRGSGKLWRDRYQLQRFGTGFVRIALETGTPLVPVAVVGGEEQAPSFYDFKPLARLLGFPYFPITPFFPWFGLLGGLPLPTKYRIEFGQPVYLEGQGDESDEYINQQVQMLRGELSSLLQRLLSERQHIFW
jgi:1-acyl-sn-glycerol-3-phosphate acyltransferase